MGNLQIEELKESYYEYAGNLSSGINIIVSLLRNNQLNDALYSIVNLAEGIDALLKIEMSLRDYGYSIQSRIVEANDLLHEVNDALENQDFILVADLFEYEIHPLFSSASEWIFTEAEQG